MISVSDALSALFALVDPVDQELVPLRDAHNRVLASEVKAMRDQPPFAASAMDGYAVRGEDVQAGATFNVVGEAAAGHRFAGSVGKGCAVRIFTGAPLPDGTSHVVIQEDVARKDNTITVQENYDQGPYVRPAGADFVKGQAITAPRLLSPADVALLAAMNIPNVPVKRKPQVAIIATGDELVQPGETPNSDQIIASNSYGLAALIGSIGADARLLPIARDNEESLQLAFKLTADADLILTIGGASVGDHDLVGKVAADIGLVRSFYKVAMRPGKPLMAGRIGNAMLIGLPGNPVSAMVCGHIFVVPVIKAMLGLPATPAKTVTATLAHDIKANGPREHYMRGHIEAGQVTVFERQDSALLTVLADANCLVKRPPNATALAKGEFVELVLT